MPSLNTIKLNEERQSLRKGMMRVLPPPDNAPQYNRHERRKMLQQWCREKGLKYADVLHEMKNYVAPAPEKVIQSESADSSSVSPTVETSDQGIAKPG